MDYHKVNSNGKEKDNLDMDHGRKHYKSHIDCCSWMKTQDIIRDIITEISNQSTEPQYLQNMVLFAHLGSHKLCASCFRNMCTAACKSTGSGEMGSCYCAKSLNWPKSTAVNHGLLSMPSLGSCKPSVDSRVPKEVHQTESARAVFV